MFYTLVLTEDTNGTVLKYQNGPGIDNKLSVKQGTTTNYFLADHLGSTNALTDSTGAITASQSYDSFGNPMNSNFPTRYQFTGREYDQTTRLQFSRARFYDPKLGRFISEDPIGFGGGDVNLYGYVGNNPLHLTDPDGLSPFGFDFSGYGSAAWNEQYWRAQQDLLEAAAPALEYGIGFGDTYLFNVPRYIRQWQGIDDPSLDCSVAYQAGGWTAIGFQAATGGVGLYRAGLGLSVAGGGQRVFWSGRELAKNAAQKHAGAIGGTTLEMTLGGRIAAGAERFLPSPLASSLWRDLSTSFARSARGSASVVHNGMGIGVNSTWAGIEYPILVRNSISLTYHVVFP